MGKCFMCNRETDQEVLSNIGTTEYLCEICEDKFQECEVCEQMYLGEELDENGVCDSCNEIYVEE